jgi:hypothetical protein
VIILSSFIIHFNDFTIFHLFEKFWGYYYYQGGNNILFKARAHRININNIIIDKANVNKSDIKSIKIKILGRERNIYKDGRKSYIIYNKQKMYISDARQLEKEKKKSK